MEQEPRRRGPYTRTTNRRPTALGDAMARARVTAGLSGVDLAEAMGWPAPNGGPRVSRIEGGTQLPTDDAVTRWATATRATRQEVQRWRILAQAERDARTAGGRSMAWLSELRRARRALAIAENAIALVGAEIEEEEMHAFGEP